MFHKSLPRKQLGAAFCPGWIDVPYALDRQLILPSPNLLLPHSQRIADGEASLKFDGLRAHHPLCHLGWKGEELGCACPAQSGCWST